MKRITTNVMLKYTFDPKGHKGAPYFVDGGKAWMNNGDFMEVMTKAALGFEPVKDGNTAFDEGSDIPEINASVKSARFTLAGRKLGPDFDSFFNEYFRLCHSNLWIYSAIVNDKFVMYFMQEDEFKTFVRTWCEFNERHVIRCKNSQVSILAWLEKNITETP